MNAKNVVTVDILFITHLFLRSVGATIFVDNLAHPVYTQPIHVCFFFFQVFFFFFFLGGHAINRDCMQLVGVHAPS